MCLFYTNFFLRNKKTWKAIEKKLTINYIPVQFTYGVIFDGSVNLFVLSSVRDR